MKTNFETLEAQLAEVFDSEFDIRACLALRKATEHLSVGKKRAVVKVAETFGYSDYVRSRNEKEMGSSNLPGVVIYHYKEAPWEDCPPPTNLAVTNLKCSLMAICIKNVGDLLNIISENPRQFAWQYVNYWKALICIFPDDGYKFTN